jgi:hypothetical protein
MRLRLSEHWVRYRLRLLEPGVPSTNNRTEQAIRKLKTRARTDLWWGRIGAIPDLRQARQA